MLSLIVPCAPSGSAPASLMPPHSPLHPSGYTLQPLQASCTPSVTVPGSLHPSSSPCPAPQLCAPPQARPLVPTPPRLSPTSPDRAAPGLTPQTPASPAPLLSPAAPPSPHAQPRIPTWIMYSWATWYSSRLMGSRMWYSLISMAAAGHSGGQLLRGFPLHRTGPVPGQLGPVRHPFRTARGTLSSARYGVWPVSEPLCPRVRFSPVSFAALGPGFDPARHHARLSSVPPGTARPQVRPGSEKPGPGFGGVWYGSATLGPGFGPAQSHVRLSPVPLGPSRPRVRPGSAPLVSAPLPWQRGPLHSPPPARPPGLRRPPAPPNLRRSAPAPRIVTSQPVPTATAVT